MWILRALGMLILLLAVVAIVVDGTKSLAASELIITSLGEQWFKLHAPSLSISQAAIERHVHPFLWDPVITALLRWPTWALLGVLGFVLYLFGRRKSRVRVFSN